MSWDEYQEHCEKIYDRLVRGLISREQALREFEELAERRGPRIRKPRKTGRVKHMP